MSYYIVDDGTSEPWIYDDGESYSKYGLEIPDWLADDIKGRDYKFSEKIHNGADLKDWLIDRDVCPEQGGIYRSELLEFIKDHCSWTASAFWLKDIPGIKIMDEQESDE